MSDISQQMTAVECQNNVLLTYEQSPRKKLIFGHSSLNPHAYLAPGVGGRGGSKNFRAPG